MAGTTNIVGEVHLLVKPLDPNGQFNAGVNSIIKRLEAQAQFQVKASGLEQVQQGVTGISQAFGQAAIQAAGLTAAIYGIKRGVEGAIAKFSGLFDQLAQAKAGFTSILHSEAAGGELLNDIREFARVSPFVTQELVNYSQQLLGVGLAAKEIIPLLKSTGDIISSVGGDTQNLGRVLFTLTQIKSIGVLKGQDTMQLQNSLIPITKYLSEYLHKSAAEIIKLREAGLITADTVFNALNQQGEKVQGAMDKATRNIAGARAILSDTITQLFQNQPVLNKIFEDIFKSIQALANRLGEEDFQQAFAQFFDGVEVLYEGVKPLVAALAGLADSGLISGLQIFGTTIGLLGKVLSALPVGVMEVIARLLFALSILKAPLLLIAYVRNIATMAAAILPATKGLASLGTQAQKTAVQISEETAAIQANTAATRANATAQVSAATTTNANRGKLGLLGGGGKLGAGILAGSIAAEFGGSILSQKDSTGAKTAGGALQGAGIGAQIGSIGGPWGAAAGALVGGALGGVTSYMAATEAKAKAHVEEMQKLGTESAEAFIKEEGKKFGEGPSGLDFTARQEEIRRLQREIRLKEAALRAEDPKVAAADAADVSDAGVLKAPKFDAAGAATTLALAGTARKAVEDEVTQAKAALETLAPDTAAMYEVLTSAATTLVSGLDKGTDSFDRFTKATKGGRIAADIPTLEKELARLGFTLEDMALPERQEEIIRMMKAFDGLTTAEQKATEAAIKLNAALKTARETVAAVYDPVQTQISDQIAQLAIPASVGSAALGAGLNPNDQAKQLEFQLAASKAAEDARSRQLADDNLALEVLKQRLKLEAAGKKDNAEDQARLIAEENTAAAARQNAAAQDVLTAAYQRLTAARLLAGQYSFLDQYNEMKAVGDLLGSLYEVTDKNVVQLSSDMSAAGDVVRTFAAQSQALTQSLIAAGEDPFEALNTGTSQFSQNLELLQLELGLSNEAFASYLATIGVIQPTFSGLSGTFAEVAEQLHLPESVLANIVGIVGQIPTDMNMVITANGQQAIDELNRIMAAYDSVAQDGERHGAGPVTRRDLLQDVVIKGETTYSTGANKPSPGAGAKAADGADKVASATEALIAKLEAAAQAIADAAERWVGSIKERTQYESAVSAGTATRNARRQIKDLTEITAGLAVLRARGLSDEAIKALGIDNVNDVKQVRKLVKASDSDLGALSQSVAGLGEKATILATSEEDTRTRKNIAEGILAAAKTLEIGITKPEAAALAAQFTITTTSDAEAIAKAILEALTSGSFGR